MRQNARTTAALIRHVSDSVGNSRKSTSETPGREFNSETSEDSSETQPLRKGFRIVASRVIRLETLTRTQEAVHV